VCAEDIIANYNFFHLVRLCNFGKKIAHIMNFGPKMKRFWLITCFSATDFLRLKIAEICYL